VQASAHLVGQHHGDQRRVQQNLGDELFHVPSSTV
jgi:hypothetical protein